MLQCSTSRLKRMHPSNHTDSARLEGVGTKKMSELGQHMDTRRQACIDLEKATRCITQALQHEIGRNQELCVLIYRLEEKEAEISGSLTEQVESNKELKLKVVELQKDLEEKHKSMTQANQTVVLLKKELRELRQQRQSQQSNRTVQDVNEWLQGEESQIRQIRIPSSPLQLDELTAAEEPLVCSEQLMSSDSQIPLVSPDGQIPLVSPDGRIPLVSPDGQIPPVSGIKEENADNGYEECSQYERTEPRTERTQTTYSAADIKSEQIQTSLVSSDGQMLLEAAVSDDEEYGHSVKRRRNGSSATDQTMNPSTEIKAEQMFQVVEFHKENPITVAVVVKSWIAATSEGQICYWPPSKASKKVKRAVAPDKDRWQKRPVRMVPHTPTNEYMKALHWARMAETQCSVESNSGVDKRTSVVYVEDTSDSSTTDDEDQPVPRLSHQALAPPPPPPPQPRSQQHDSGLSLNGLPTPSGSSSLACEFTDTAGQTGDIKQLMAMMTSFQTRVLAKIDQVLETKQELIRLVCAAATSAPASNLLPGPCATQEDLDALCVRILTEDDFQKQLVSVLCLDSSKRLGMTVRRMMTRLGTRELWSAYSMRGRKKKACFADLPLLQMVTMACTTCHPEVKIADVEKEVADFLKHAPFKKGGTGKSGASAPEQHHQHSPSPRCPSPTQTMLLF
ncbi:hypothetical protein AALO_G00090830 [Alosa alosa]|uniref:DUF4806 domain-containing protein n=1 Tax=Alosa alosa TaxID=278164 RepID=A0AAV6GXP9_9TELE|nr:uncharacterized protein LOC125297283 isoform X1 [Alosa alosa]KAG5277736.1 hypothetical protein AALO_G00090830 [Alosa alosa]